MVWLKECPRCRGDLYLNKDTYVWYRKCLQCGYLEDSADFFVPDPTGIPVSSWPPVPTLETVSQLVGPMRAEQTG